MITAQAIMYLEKEAGFKDLVAIFRTSPLKNKAKYLEQALKARHKGSAVEAKALYMKHRT